MPDPLKYFSGVFKGERAVIRQVDTFSAEINERIYVAALGLLFDDGGYLFFDPLSFDGIASGGEKERDGWIDGYPDTDGNSLVKIPGEKITFTSWKNPL